jgi:large conductance mechanosensitive channel
VGAAYGDAMKLAPTLGYGKFISDVINFLIMAFVVFLMVKAFTNAKERFMKEKPAAPAAPPRSEVLLEDIKNLLAKGR